MRWFIGILLIPAVTLTAVTQERENRKTVWDGVFTPAQERGREAYALHCSAPASLSDATYVDIVAHILTVNMFPAGKQEDAYVLCSLAVDLHVTQVVDQTKGVHAMLPKSIFK